MFKNLKIQNKLLVGFGFITLFVLILGITNYSSMNRIDDKKTDLLSAYETADAIMETKFYLKAEALILMEIMGSEGLEEVEKRWETHINNREGIIDDIKNAIGLLSDENWGHENVAEKLKYLNEIKKVQDVYMNQIDGLFNNMYSLIKNTGELESIHDQMDDFDHRLDPLILELEGIIEDTELGLGESVVNNSRKNINRTISSAKTSSLLVMLLSLGFAVLLTYAISRIIVKPIKGLKVVIESLSDGDLRSNYDYDAEDEVGLMTKSLNRMVKKLNEIIGGIMEGATGIQSASGQINSGAQQISQSSSEAAASVEEISSSVEEMASNIQQNTDNARETEKIAVQSAETINKGNESVQVTLKSMNQIAEKITIINDIAFQTNILALNAAVEAARAGEHGKGFAVVASEVRKLAEHSKYAADEIDSLSMYGVRISEEAGRNLVDVVPHIKKTAALVQEITAASMEQSSGASQINDSIQQLSQVAQQNAFASEELAATAEELNSQSDQLREMISFFRI